MTDVSVGESDSKSGFDSHPSFRDFTSFIFQPQYIIANQVSLFYRTDSMAHRQKLINLFSYILQAVDNQYLEYKEESKLIDRELQDLTKELEKQQRGFNKLIGQLRGFYLQAKEFGLLKKYSYPEDDWKTEDFIIKLKRVPEEVNDMNLFQMPLDAVTKTSNRISELTTLELNTAHELQNLKHRQELLKKLIDSNTGYRDDLLHQHARLKTSSWFNQLIAKHEEQCPFCLSINNNGKKYIETLIKANNQIISKGVQLNDNGAVLRSEHRKLISGVQIVIKKLNEVRQELDVLKKGSNDESQQLNTVNSIYRFAGKIETELSSYDRSTDDQIMLSKIKALEERKQFISDQINQDVVFNKVKRAKKKLPMQFHSMPKFLKLRITRRLYSLMKRI
ncbi:hypothetical protein [Mucilaginibacter antarcticus]|uniref:hypothetical protein n=1 Tax=Mucilaginibacter antarcticus TaxID=1855725 RepID=UPI00362B186F